MVRFINDRQQKSVAGTKIASVDTYEEARALVERLDEAGYPLRNISIVGSDLLSVEQIRGRSSAGGTFLNGLVNGAWFGMILGLMMTFAVPEGYRSIVLPGAIFAMSIIFGCIRMIMYSLGSEKRGLRTRTFVVANRYHIYVLENPTWAREQLARVAPRRIVDEASAPKLVAPIPVAAPGDGEGTGTRGEAVSADPGTDGEASELKPTEFGSRPDEKPKFGVRLSPEERARRLAEAEAKLEPVAPEKIPTKEELQKLPPSDEESFPGGDKNPFK